MKQRKRRHTVRKPFSFPLAWRDETERSRVKLIFNSAACVTDSPLAGRPIGDIEMVVIGKAVEDGPN